MMVLLKCSVVFLLLAVVPPLTRAAIPESVTFTWDPNSEPDIKEYKLHIGTASGEYALVIPVGLATRYTLTQLPTGSKFYFALTAVNTSGLEGDYSEEVSLSTGHELSGQQISTGFRLTVSGDPLTMYRLEVSNDLRVWDIVDNRVSDSLGKVVLTESRSAQGRWRFFRAVKVL